MPGDADVDEHAIDDRSVALTHRSRAFLVEAVLCGLAIVTWVSLSVVWLVRHRSGQPLNIDEAGYLGIALNYAGGWERGGPPGWLDTVLAPSVHAPLTPATASIGVVMGMEPRTAAFATVLGFSVVTTVFAVLLAAHFRVRGAMICSCLVLLAAPGFAELGRNFIFAVPAAAVTVAALYFLVRTEGLDRTRWAIALGVAVGLMPLTRTLMIAFVPVIVAVVAVNATATWVRERSAGRRRIANGAVAAAVATGVGATWLVPSGRLVFDYLTGYGYGKHAADYTVEVAIPPLRLLTAASRDFHAPILVFVVVACLIAIWRRRTSSVRLFSRPGLVEAANSPLLACAAFVLGAAVALMSSKNVGFGFTVPLIAPTVVLAVVVVLRAARASRRTWSAPLVVALIAVSAVVLTWPRFDSTSPLAEQRFIIAGSTSITITDGATSDPAYVFQPTRQASPRVGDLVNESEWGDDWSEAVDALTAEVLDGSTARPDVAFGFRDRFANVNSVQLEVLERLGYGIPVAQVDPTEWGRSTSDYTEWLTTGPAGSSCQLLIAPGFVNELTPLPGTPALRAAAVSVGFIKGDSVRLPDGREVQVWERDALGC